MGHMRVELMAHGSPKGVGVTLPVRVAVMGGVADTVISREGVGVWVTYLGVRV